MDGMLGFHGWHWMFVIEGLMASVVGLLAIWYLVDKPQDADWMTTKEKNALIAELQAENEAKPPHYSSPWRVLIDPRVLFLCLVYFTIQTAVYGVTFYLPTQVAGLLKEKVGLTVGMVSAIPWVCALLAAITIPAYSDQSGKRGGMAAVILGCGGIALMFSSTSDPYYGIGALCIAVASYFAVQPIFWTMPSRFLTGVTAASGIGLINAVGNLGGFTAPNLRFFAEQYFHSPVAGLYAIGGVAFFGALLLLISIPLGLGNNTPTWHSQQTTHSPKR
jgi:sugar phosphate permease